MINVKELRIGNWIKKNNAEFCVAAISLPLMDIEIFHPENEDEYPSIPIEIINPIPLTEEWLLRFGFEVCRFEEDGSTWYIKDTFEVLVDEDNNSINYCTRYRSNGLDFKSGFVIKTVHQLQNLYFALTGEELKIKQ